MSSEAPIPLKSTSDVPLELAEALRALRDGHGDQERIARVGQKLGPLLDAPPPSSPFTPGLGHGLFKSLAAKLAASAFVLAGAGAWLMQSEARSETRGAADSAVAVQAATAPVLASGNASEPAVVVALGSDVPAPAAVEAKATEDGVPAGRGSSSARGDTLSLALSRKERGRKRESGRAGRRVSDSVAEPMAEAASPSVADDIPVEEPAAQAPVPALEQPVVAPGPTEVDLLFTARKQLRSEPGAALRLLDEHAARFPNGMLAPEREVLAIEALRKLGRNPEAEQRLSRFKAQHPDSPHLRTLH